MSPHLTRQEDLMSLKSMGRATVLRCSAITGRGLRRSLSPRSLSVSPSLLFVPLAIAFPHEVLCHPCGSGGES
jgi:hypothetical protein